MEPEFIIYRWSGPRDEQDDPVAGDAYLPGVPTRDLTTVDLAALPAHVRDDIAASPLYGLVDAEET